MSENELCVFAKLCSVGFLVVCECLSVLLQSIAMSYVDLSVLLQSIARSYVDCGDDG